MHVAPEKTYGRLWLDGDDWHLQCEPHVALMAKRIFQRIDKGSAGTLKIKHSDSVARDLEWFVQRYPLQIESLADLTAASRRHQDKILTLNQILGGEYKPRTFKLALPPRDYQSVAAELYTAQGYLLLGDDVGIGKTVSAIAALRDSRTLPACIVTLAHLPRQWEKEINRFAPDLFTHVLKKGTPYELPMRKGRRPDVLITNYHKLTGWADVLASYCKSVTYDEIQELRHSGTNRYTAAKHISWSADFCLGLSATPIYNYGGEIFNVLNAIKPGLLGTADEFYREWCTSLGNGKYKIREPHAFGSHLREQHIMLRRTRSDVGRELPPMQKIVQEVDSDTKAFEAIEDAASELARIILSRGEDSNFAKMQAAEEFNSLMRQTTGIAKAPHVAAFVKMLIESGESVVLFGWHRAVYEIWKARLAEFEPAIYTGSESVTQKQAAAERFTSGQTKLLILSLRSGAGLDGLQHCCRTTVHGELDWSPGVHEQNIGRVFRDGQKDPVISYFLLADSGSDPIIAETLGLKREQIEGIRDAGKAADLERLSRDEAGIKKLAEAYLARKRT